jgi:O-antigen/teichoic acid export membrane protein
MSAFLRGAWLTLITRITSMVLGIASSVIVARALGPEGKGEYALIALIAVLLQTAGGMGLDQAALYKVARGKEQVRRLAAFFATVSGILGIVLCGVHWVLTQIPWYLHYLAVSGVDVSLVWILVLLLPATLAGQSLTMSLLGLERYGAYNAASLVMPVTLMALLLLFVLAMDQGVGGAVAATAGTSAVTLLAAGFILWRVAPPAATSGGKATLEGAFSFGWRAHLANIAWFLHYRLDMFLVGYLLGPAALGFYSTAVGLAEKLYMIPSVIGTLVFPRVAATDPVQSVALTARACRHSLWITAALAGVLGLVAYPAVHLLYGMEFLPSVQPLWILLPGVILLALARVLSADLNGRGLPGVVARVNIAMALMNLLLNLWWIPIWGIAGAAAATTLSYTLMALLLGMAFRKRSNAAWSDLLLFRRGDFEDLRRAFAALRGAPQAPVQTEIVP